MLSATLPALALILTSIAGAQSVSPNANPLAVSRVFTCDQVTGRVASNGSVGCKVFTGTLATGESVAVHETTQPAGAAPNPAHRIQHSELIVVREGTLEFHHDGKVERAAPGSIIYVAYGTLHAVKNVGKGPARYVVIQIGGDTKK
jgi:XRE family transcriptional regulator, regulator of sulfur utilization